MKMATIEEIIAKNVKNLVAVINGHVESATVGGVTISNIDIRYVYHFRVGGFDVYVDEIEVLPDTVRLICNNTTIGFLSLKKE
jgi:hypothetical protein